VLNSNADDKPCSCNEGWNRGVSKETLLEVYRDFDHNVKTLLEMSDSTTLKVWTLLDMDRIPNWANGRLALIGDAAHPFLPRKISTPTMYATILIPI
jgi:2-polyprenyl-6-methoxyphenol hydroxylase-like FAD-dependent oxidoreductase